MPFFLAHDAKLQKTECLENQIVVCADFQIVVRARYSDLRGFFSC